jgi:hypothetical protein
VKTWPQKIAKNAEEETIANLEPCELREIGSGNEPNFARRRAQKDPEKKLIIHHEIHKIWGGAGRRQLTTEHTERTEWGMERRGSCHGNVGQGNGRTGRQMSDGFG